MGKFPVSWQISPALRPKKAGNWLLAERRQAALSPWTPLDINYSKRAFSSIADSDLDVRASSHRLSNEFTNWKPICRIMCSGFLVTWCTRVKAACFLKTLGYFCFSLHFSQQSHAFIHLIPQVPKRLTTSYKSPLRHPFKGWQCKWPQLMDGPDSGHKNSIGCVSSWLFLGHGMCPVPGNEKHRGLSGF